MQRQPNNHHHQHHHHQQQAMQAFGPAAAATAADRSHHHQRPTAAAAGPNTRLLGGKDLIIRMLAEVFQVSQTDDGQVKWQQVSSSLVPVSLYSRTTNNWLNYLLAASSAAATANNTAASGMSHDSRDFILLLQRFHHQQQQLATTGGGGGGRSLLAAEVTGARPMTNEQGLVVFQVVAHDYIDGQCKKILNVKLLQPGTRLGQASDYFVYWKEQQPLAAHHHQHQHHLHPHHHHHHQYQQQLLSTSPFVTLDDATLARQFALNGSRPSPISTSSCCQQQPTTSAPESQTWGLNFASINDAKLFYDICSLNLVDLDFNSDYLKHLVALSDRNVSSSVCQQPQTFLPAQNMLASNNQNEQKIIRDFLNYKQRQLQTHSQSRAQAINQQQQRQQQQQLYLCQQQPQAAYNENSFKRQLSSASSKCPSCKHLTQASRNNNHHQQQLFQQLSRGNNRPANDLVDLPTTMIGCPVHSQQQQLSSNQRTSSRQNSTSMRTRSRSTTRHPTTSTTTNTMAAPRAGAGDRDTVKRARSFSTPASPEPKSGEPTCLVHGPHEGHAADDFQQAFEQRAETHHPRCISLMKKQRELLKKQSTSESERPQKPARGVMRESSVNASNNNTTISTNHANDRPPKVPPHQSSVSSNQSAHSKSTATAKSRYMGGQLLNNQVPRKKVQELLELEKGAAGLPHQRSNGQSTEEASAGERSQTVVSIAGVGGEQQKLQTKNRVPNPDFQVADGMHDYQNDQEAALKFVASRSAQRRSTGIDYSISGNLDQFDSLSHRNARLARAQYANSRNMKEFLSLDAGGMQSTPTQLVKLNERFQQQQQMKSGGALKQQELKKKSSTGNSRQTQILSDSEMPHKDSGALVYGGSGPDVCEMEAVRNVSTTTDDLPLDPQTKKRMFKLTSEEVISERTEPESVSRVSGQEIQLQLQQDRARSEMEKTNRQLRAVSLGPEVDKELRGRNVRSDTGRRRSLERSMCVDLDPSLPVHHSFKKSSQRRLSPLPQSASPMILDSSKSSITYIGPDAFGEQQHQPNLQLFASIPEKEGGDLATSPKRARTKSSGENDQGYVNMASGDGFGGGQEACQHQQQYCNGRMISFKSAPDVSQVSYERPNDDELDGGVKFNTCDRNLHHVAGFAPHLADRCGVIDPGYQVFNMSGSATAAAAANAQTIPKSGGLSSYAIPLCSGERRTRTSCARKFHSCPNSLRRKRRDLHGFSSGLQPQCQHSTNSNYPISATHHLDECRSQLCLREHDRDMDLMRGSNIYRGMAVALGNEPGRYLHCECSFCLNQSAPLPLEAELSSEHCIGGGGFAGADYAAFVNKSSAQQQHHCQHHRLTCMNNEPANESKGGYDKRFVVSRPDCIHSSAQHRPCSSLSSRSPLRYGLYESDCEDEPSPPQQRRHQQHSDTCQHPHLRQDCCASTSQDQPFSRSSSMYFRAAFTPVQGYDQTMARSSLKSRHRAKSQPPNSADDAFHLTKSMENVQKLIKEVQNELNAMAERPVSGLQCLRKSLVEPETSSISKHHQTTTTSHERAQSQGAATRTPISTQSKMANEEQSVMGAGLPRQAMLGGANDEQQQPSSKLVTMSGTSATRRAAQFKCVGAIRKAGFLSVKKWIIKRRQSIELARKQGWKRYWVCLRGTALLFHSVIDKKDVSIDDPGSRIDLLSWIQANCAGQAGQMVSNYLLQADQQQQATQSDGGANQRKDDFMSSMSQCFIEKEPRHLIIIEGAIAQPIPEHPKRDFVFCLSTTFGDAYLFQAGCQLESDNWISAIHNACAASIARDLTRDEAIKLFETKIRHLELEAEKKLFLRLRLESRLTSMSSIGHFRALTAFDDNSVNQEAQAKQSTMRTLLQRLNQQLLALDTYIEQVHCEVYQLRCYLSSCGVQQLFYQNIMQQTNQSATSISPTFMSIDLPHPKSLLMHVSKPTKLLLIKLGVFTVSSFHAYIHARQGSAETILRKIQQSSRQSSNPSLLDLKVTKPPSISEALLSKTQNVELETDTEQLINMSNLKLVRVKLTKKLVSQIRRQARGSSSIGDQEEEDGPSLLLNNESDDRFSIHEQGSDVVINLKLHSNSHSLSIIKQVLSIVNPSSSELDFLNYYLQFKSSNGNSSEETARGGGGGASPTQYVTKRRETLNDWRDFECLELMEKIIFKVELSKSSLDEEAAPFGISVGAQLFVGAAESLLNVFCSYIEWGSVADKAGLKDDDEFLMINGIPVMDLDMMFIECIIQDETKLTLVVRSSRTDCPSNSVLLDKLTWGPASDRDGGGDDRHHRNTTANEEHQFSGGNVFDGMPGGLQSGQAGGTLGSQIISDEYISSLVCPPPPAQSSAFLRMDSTLLRQKSDMTATMSFGKQQRAHCRTEPLVDETDKARLSTSTTIPSFVCEELGLSRAKSQQSLGTITDEPSVAALDAQDAGQKDNCSSLAKDEDDHHQKPSEQSAAADLASQLVRKTEQLTQLLGHSNNPAMVESLNDDLLEEVVAAPNVGDNELTNRRRSSDSKGTGADPNSVERLKKSILELLETEYAYIRHLETISEHYMTPLEEMAYLGVPDLKHLNQIIIDLILFQKDLFDKLSSGFSAVRCHESSSTMAAASKSLNDEFEGLNQNVQQLESLKTPDDFRPILQSLAKTFLDEADRFKIYAAYCVAYSKLQKLLHPKKVHKSTSIASAPNALDTFLGSNVLGSSSSTTISGSGGGGTLAQHRDFLRPLGSFLANTTESGALQLKQLNEFLGNLDSSSSSASLSLPKSSGSDATHTDQQQQRKSTAAAAAPAKCPAAASPFQKSVHQQNFESYLIKPIQRIVKYPMLLNSIAISAQMYAGGDVHKELKAALRQMEAVTSHVNDTQRIHDEYGLIFDHIERLFLEQQAELLKTSASPIVGPHQPTISLSIGKLLYFGPVDWLNINEFAPKLKKGMNLSQVLFVFNSCVVFICKELVRSTKKRLPISHHIGGTSSTQTSSLTGGSKAFINHELIRYQSLIPVSEVQVRSLPTGHLAGVVATKASSARYQWELFRCSSVNSNSSLLTKTTTTNKRSTGGKVYMLASPTNEGRNAFLRKIRFTIRESVRNMSLPLARSPSSKSLTPKKLSSPSSATNTNSSCSHSTSLSPVCNREAEHCEQLKGGEGEFSPGKVEPHSSSNNNNNNNNYTKTSIKVNN